MKRIGVVLLTIVMVAVWTVAAANTIQVSSMGEAKLYETYAQVLSQIQLNRFSNAWEYATVTDYEDIERNPWKHTGEKLYFQGKVLQVLEGSGRSATYRVAMNGNSNQVFLLTYTRPEDSERFLEDDQVQVYCQFVELNTYSSTVNLSVTVPYCKAALIIRPVTNTTIAGASDSELQNALIDIRKRLDSVVAKDQGCFKMTKSNYEDYARHEQLHSKEKISVTGKAVQVVEGTVRNVVRLAVDSDSSKIVYLTVDPTLSNIRILENDQVTIRGTYTGLYTYSSTRGGDITIPSASAEYVNVKGYTIPSSFPKDSNGNYKVTKATFQDYARRPNAHKDEPIAFSAKVLQVIEGSTVSTYRMAVDSDSSYVMYVRLANSSRTTRILEDDVVTVVAKFGGLYTYESTMGAPITIPQCTASSVTVPGKSTASAQKNSSGAYKVTKSNYESFARNESTYLNQRVTFTARVIQVMDTSSGVIYRLAVDKSYDAVFLGTLSSADLDVRILEDDTVTVEGISTGLYSYNSTMGGKITIPSCKITSYSIQGYTKKSLGSPDSSGYYRITKSNYTELARNPKPYVGKNITFRGKVVQVVERSSGPNIYRVSVDSDSSCMFYVEYNLPRGSSRILQNDIVTLKGEYYGIYTYSTTMGSSVSVPAIIATYMSK